MKSGVRPGEKSRNRKKIKQKNTAEMNQESDREGYVVEAERKANESGIGQRENSRNREKTIQKPEDRKQKRDGGGKQTETENRNKPKQAKQNKNKLE